MARPNTVMACPNNVWTPSEFDRIIDRFVADEKSVNGPYATCGPDEHETLRNIAIYCFNSQIVPAGNA